MSLTHYSDEYQIKVLRDELSLARDKVADLRAVLNEIADLASWHYDPEADERNESPEDMAAHVNGLIVRKALAAIGDK